MMTFLAVVHIIACLGLITLVLLQDSKGGGAFTSQASSTSVLGAGGAATLAQTTTKVIACIFAMTCIGLSILSARSQKSVIDTLPATAAQQAPAATTTPAATATTATPAATTAQPAATTQSTETK
ncbi:MAG: preprotein translocase subunit SecG [Pseudobdellovibrio sp.]